MSLVTPEEKREISDLFGDEFNTVEKQSKSFWR
jgi:hypothetical protein